MKDKQLRFEIPDALHRRLKSRAADEGITLKALVLDALEKRIAAPAPERLTAPPVE